MFWFLWLGFMAVMIGLWTGACFPKKAKLPVSAAPPGIRYCRDCRFFLPQQFMGLRWGIALARCAHHTAMRSAADFLVRGHLHEDNMGYAELQRAASFKELSHALIEFQPEKSAKCGPEGKYWEAR